MQVQYWLVSSPTRVGGNGFVDGEEGTQACLEDVSEGNRQAGRTTQVHGFKECEEVLRIWLSLS
jgi:hypothetical protein